MTKLDKQAVSDSNTNIKPILMVQSDRLNKRKVKPTRSQTRLRKRQRIADGKVKPEKLKSKTKEPKQSITKNNETEDSKASKHMTEEEKVAAKNKRRREVQRAKRKERIHQKMAKDKSDEVNQSEAEAMNRDTLNLVTTEETPWTKSKKRRFRIQQYHTKAQADLDAKHAVAATFNSIEEPLSGIDDLSLNQLKSRLNSSRFRYLNEQLYIRHSTAATKLFTDDQSLFEIYHQGYQLQIHKWPVKPIERAIAYVLLRPETDVIVDMGCGDALLARSVPHDVTSFDLRALNDRVTVADMANIPLERDTVDVVICCLSLMGTNLLDFIKEAHRLLKPGGTLWIAEVASRFGGDITPFCFGVESVGFTIFKQNTSCSTHFCILQFKKTLQSREERMNKLLGTWKPKKSQELQLAPCLYKKR